MKVVLNGRDHLIASATTLAALLESLGHRDSGKGVAAALNGEVVARSRWSETRLSEGDRVEVVGAVQGG